MSEYQMKALNLLENENCHTMTTTSNRAVDESRVGLPTNSQSMEGETKYEDMKM